MDDGIHQENKRCSDCAKAPERPEYRRVVVEVITLQHDKNTGRHERQKSGASRKNAL